MADKCGKCGSVFDIQGKYHEALRILRDGELWIELECSCGDKIYRRAEP